MKDAIKRLEVFLKKDRYRRRYSVNTQREIGELIKAEIDTNFGNLKILSIFLIANFVFRMFVRCAFDVGFLNSGFAMAVAGISYLLFSLIESMEGIENDKVRKCIYVLFWIIIDVIVFSYLKVEIAQLEGFGYFIVFMMMFSALFVGSLGISCLILIPTYLAGVLLLHTSGLSGYKILLFESSILWITVITIVIVQIKYKSFVNGKKAVFKLKNVSEIDLLTHLYNRRGMERVLEEEWELLKDTQKRVTAILMDIDHFKSYNDTYGHIAGDNCLKEVSASIIKSCEETTDVVVRYGGEEIVVVVCGMELKDAETLAYKIKDDVENLKIKSGSASDYEFVTVSIGVGSIIASNENNVYSAIDRADENLYHSKFTGRNKVTVEKVNILK